MFIKTLSFYSSLNKSLILVSILAFVSSLAADDTANTTVSTTESPVGTGTHGTDCTNDKDCDGKIGLTCQQSKCECARPKEMLFDNEKSVCLVLESYSCTSNVTGMTKDFDCIKHAKCKEDESRGSKICQCDEGYSVTADNKCYGDLDTNCEVDKDPCNPLAALNCMTAEGSNQGKCACPAPKDNIYEDGKCKAVAGAGCILKNPGVVLTCIGNSTCREKKDSADKNVGGICECDEDLVMTTNRTCAANAQVIILPGVVTVLGTIIFAVLVR